MAKTKLEKELRYVNVNPSEFLKVEKRADGDEEQDVMVLEGYPITFNQETLIGDEDWGWIESIDPHAVDEADMRDCCLKYNHNDTSPIMARTRNGSLKLTTDEKGVFMRAELIDTQSNKDFYKMVKAGLLDKMSFAFTVDSEEVDNRSNPIKRIIKRIGKLFDVSVVDIPAYDSTSLYARSKAMAEAKPDELENSSTEDAKLENKAKAEQEGEPKAEPTKSEDKVDGAEDKPNGDEPKDLDKNQEAKPDDEKRKFEFAKRKAIAKLKLGGFWYE
jgi:HK97 family phage prohead protease